MFFWILLTALALYLRGTLIRTHNPFSILANIFSTRLAFELCAQVARAGAIITALIGLAYRRNSNGVIQVLLLAYNFALGIVRITLTTESLQSVILHQINLIQVMTLFLALIFDVLPILALNAPIRPFNLVLWKVSCIAASVAISAFTPRLWSPPSVSLELSHRLPEDGASPEETCSYFSYFSSYGWMTGLVLRGCQGKLQLDDLPPLPWFDEPLIWLDRVLQARKSQGKTLRTVIDLLCNDIRDMTIFSVLTALFELVAPFAGFRLLQDLAHPENAVYQAYAWVALLFIGLVVKSIATQQYLFRSTRLMVRLKISVTQELYQKTLRCMDYSLPAKTEKDSSDENGSEWSLPTDSDDEESYVHDSNRLRVMNLVSQDIESLTLSKDIVLVLAATPIVILLSTTFLYHLLGWPSFIGLAILLASFPVTTILTRRMAVAQEAVMRSTDARISLVSEYLTSIRTIKHFAWENTMTANVEETRKLEQNYRWKRNLYSVAIRVAGDNISFLALFAMLLIFVLGNGQQLNAATAFTSLTITEVLRQQFLTISTVARFLEQSWEACKRIDLYLEAVETQQHPIGPPTLQKTTFRITPTSKFFLRKLNAEFIEGQLNIIAGSSGSGKTAVLLSLLGETILQGGSVTCPKPIAYVSQHPFLMNDTIKNNITFHGDFHQLRYDAVVEACGLQQDLAALEFGHLEHVGEGGSNLSEGQRQRVALARAVYSKSSLLLLDDVFSAIDIDTTIHIWNRCFRGGLLRNRTVILTTQQDWFRSEADVLFLMDNGRMSRAIHRPDDPLYDKVMKLVSENGIPQLEKKRGGQLLVEAHTLHAGPSQLNDDACVISPIFQETFENERNSWSLLYRYMMLFGGKMYVTLALMIAAVTQAIFFMTTLWLSIWVSHYSKNGLIHDGFYFSVFGGLLVSFLVISTIKDLIFQYGAWKAARTMHSRLISSVMATSMEWFDATPVGRIINRFSKDIYSMDALLVENLRATIDNTFRLLFEVGSIASILPIFIFPATAICACVFVVGQMYTRAQLSVKTLASASQSPVLSHFKETMGALSIIRAAGKQADFTDLLAHRLRDFARAEETKFNLNRWVAARVDAAVAFVSLMAGIIAVYKSGSVSPGLIAFSLTNVFGLNRTILGLVRKANELEVMLNCFHRLEEYASLPSEQNPARSSIQTPTIYQDERLPDSPLIEFRNVTAKYELEGPMILKNISFAVGPGERIAIVGRTGSGKTTLVLCLLGCLHITSGSILIDGVDIRHFELSQLRRDITLISQQSVLFTGSVRDNLDPTGTVEESVVAKSFDACHVLTPIANPTYQVNKVTLETRISEKGSNLSAGQRQIIAIARAIARKTKIVLIDEATAKMDSVSDNEVQQILATEFKESTVLTNTHRLKCEQSMIKDYDRIIVLADGELQEIGTPRELYDAHGLYYDMIKSSEKSGVFEAQFANVRNPRNSRPARAVSERASNFMDGVKRHPGGIDTPPGGMHREVHEAKDNEDWMGAQIEAAKNLRNEAILKAHRAAHGGDRAEERGEGSKAADGDENEEVTTEMQVQADREAHLAGPQRPRPGRRVTFAGDCE